MILVRFLDLKFLHKRADDDRNFKSTALVAAARHPNENPHPNGNGKRDQRTMLHFAGEALKRIVAEFSCLVAHSPRLIAHGAGLTAKAVGHRA